MLPQEGTTQGPALPHGRNIDDRLDTPPSPRRPNPAVWRTYSADQTIRAGGHIMPRPKVRARPRLQVNPHANLLLRGVRWQRLAISGIDEAHRSVQVLCAFVPPGHP